MTLWIVFSLMVATNARAYRTRRARALAAVWRFAADWLHGVAAACDDCATNVAVPA